MVLKAMPYVRSKTRAIGPNYIHLTSDASADRKDRKDRKDTHEPGQTLAGQFRMLKQRLALFTLKKVCLRDATSGASHGCLLATMKRRDKHDMIALLNFILVFAF